MHGLMKHYSFIDDPLRARICVMSACLCLPPLTCPPILSLHLRSCGTLHPKCSQKGAAFHVQAVHDFLFFVGT